jgi:amino acid efflux transporter
MTSSKLAESSVGTAGGVALYVTAIIGPGILTLPAAAAHTAGPLSLVALAALLAISVPAAYAFVHIHRATAERESIRGAGQAGSMGLSGIHSYASAAFGSLAGRIVGAWFFFGVPVGVSAMALIGGSYVSAAVDGGRPVTLAVAWAIAVFAIMVTLAGGRLGVALPIVLAMVLVVLILGSALVSVPEWRPETLGEIAPNGFGAIVPASLTLMWVITGWEAATNFASRLRDGETRLPKVIGLSLIVVVVLYAAVAVPELLVLGPFAGGTSAPVAEVLRAAIGQSASMIAAVLAAVLATANSVAYLGSLREIGRSLVSSSPRLTGRWREGIAVGVPALLTVAGLAAATVLPLDAAWFVELCAGSQIPVYVAALASGLVLVRARTRGWWVVLIATVAVSLLLIPAGPYLLVPLGITVGVVVVHFAGRARSPRGSPGQS